MHQFTRDHLLGRELVHGRVVRETQQVLLGRFLDHGGAVLSKGEHVHPVGDQRLRGFLGFRRAKPVLEPAHLDGGLRIDGPHPQGVRVKVPFDFRNREGANVSDLVRLRERAGHQAV